MTSFLATLTPIQKRRLLLRADNLTISDSEIARIEKVDESTIRECFKSIQKKYLKFISKNTPEK